MTFVNLGSQGQHFNEKADQSWFTPTTRLDNIHLLTFWPTLCWRRISFTLLVMTAVSSSLVRAAISYRLGLARRGEGRSV